MSEAALQTDTTYEDFNYLEPNYSPVFAKRAKMLKAIREDKRLLEAAKLHYADNPWDFINDWGMTFDPRNLEAGKMPHMPFVMWPRQFEFVKWIHHMWRSKKNGQAEKSRDCGASWLTVGFGCSMFLFNSGFVMGLGSRKAELVDKTGDAKSLFWKVRYFLENIPPEFRPTDWNPNAHNSKMLTVNPENGSQIMGEAGDQIGRGGRTSIYVVDEYAFVENQADTDAALSAVTDCQIDISTFNGPGNRFFSKNQKLKGTENLFIFDWTDDPRKDDEWLEAIEAEPDFDPVIFAQEYGRDPYASQEDSMIPAAWFRSALDAHKVLNFLPSGVRATGYDPADVGDDKAVAGRHGSVVQLLEVLKEGDITQAMPWAGALTDEYRADIMGYDADGLGAPAMKLSLQEQTANRVPIAPFYGGGSVDDPEGIYIKGAKGEEDKLNKDVFLNLRAQSWASLARRFQRTHSAVLAAKEGRTLPVAFGADDLISIDTKRCKHWQVLQAEISAPKREWSNNGKIQVESKKKMKNRGVASPNLADALVIAFAQKSPHAQKKKRAARSKTRRLKDRGAGY